MPFPKKFRALLEMGKSDLETPHHVWIKFFVCATTAGSCGWGGWMLDAVFSTREENPPNGLLAADYNPVCPQCGGRLFGTDATWRLDLSDNQYPRLQEGIDYTVEPIEYEDD